MTTSLLCIFDSYMPKTPVVVHSWRFGEKFSASKNDPKIEFFVVAVLKIFIIDFPGNVLE